MPRHENPPEDSPDLDEIVYSFKQRDDYAVVDIHGNVFEPDEETDRPIYVPPLIHGTLNRNV